MSSTKLLISQQPGQTISKLGIRSLAPHVALLCMGSTLIRFSVVSTTMGDLVAEITFLAAHASLVLALMYIAIAGIGRVNLLAAIVIPAAGFSLLGCERFDYAWPRWIAWTAMILGFGPICFTIHGSYLRRHMYDIAVKLYIVSVLLSALWWFAGLPNLGVGDFTGVMWQSIQLGSTAGIVGAIAAPRMFNGGSTKWFFIYCTCAMVALLASSRAALVAMAFATLIVIAFKLRRNAFICSITCFVGFVIAVAPTTSFELLVTVLPGNFTSGLARKSFDNTREYHWEARWEEFLSSPTSGVGFMSAWEGTMGVHPETGAVETGSSYIAILSMTGFVGATAMLIMVLSLAYGMIRYRRQMSESIWVEICSMAGFWFVHLGAEGYIYAVGSLINLTFWLWLGCLNDQLQLCRREVRAVTQTNAKRVFKSVWRTQSTPLAA